MYGYELKGFGPGFWVLENGIRMISMNTWRDYSICDDCSETTEGTFYWEDMSVASEGDASSIWSLYDSTFRPDEIPPKERAWS